MHIAAMQLQHSEHIQSTFSYTIILRILSSILHNVTMDNSWKRGVS